MSEDSVRTEGSSPARAGAAARQLIRRARQVSRRKFPAEETIRIVLEGIRGEVAVSELCRREGIHPRIYYKWCVIANASAPRALPYGGVSCQLVGSLG